MSASLPRKIIHVFGVCCITLLLFEGVLRIYEWSSGFQNPDYLDAYTLHESGLWALRPNMNHEVTLEGRKFHIRTNEFGLPMTREYIPGQSGKPVIALMGDSFTQGLWSESPDSSFGGRLDLHYPEKEVLNFGVGGYGIVDYLSWYQEFVVRFTPREVILCLFWGNDYEDAGTGLLTREKISRPNNFKALLYRYSAFFRFLARLNAGFEGITTPEKLVKTRPGNLEKYPEIWMKNEPGSPFKDWINTGIRYLDSLRIAVGQSGARMKVVGIPFLEQVYLTPEKGDHWSVYKPAQPVRDWCEKHSIPFLDLTSLFREEAVKSEEALFFEKDQHFSPAGHRLAGKLLAEWLEGQWRETSDSQSGSRDLSATENRD